MLALLNVSKHYSGIPAVDDISFSARSGEVTGYLGPNGSGKSTTMKMITGLIEMTSGRILFQGKPIDDDLIAYKRRMGYVPIVFAIALSSLKAALSAPVFHSLTSRFLMSTLIMMCLGVAGLRSVFSLPISLNANWILRVTQLYPTEKYIAATRRTLILLAVLPVWLCAALLSLGFRPLFQSAAHLVLLILMGSIMTDLSLIGLSKIPFACSYLPGKSNIQYLFWGFLIICLPISMMFAKYEQKILHYPFQFVLMVGVLAAVALVLWISNCHTARSASLYFEELPPEVITTLGLSSR